MGTLKWKNDDKWETFYYGAFENIKADLRNIIIAINNSAAAIRMRCRRDKNLSDVYSAEDSRWNLNFRGNDHSKEAGLMGKSWHNHDKKYMPYINDLIDRVGKLESTVAAHETTLKDHEARIKALEEAAKAAEGDDGPSSGDDEGSTDVRLYLADWPTDRVEITPDGYLYWGWNVAANVDILEDFIVKRIVKHEDVVKDNDEIVYCIEVCGFFDYENLPGGNGGAEIRGWACNNTFGNTCDAIWNKNGQQYRTTLPSTTSNKTLNYKFTGEIKGAYGHDYSKPGIVGVMGKKSDFDTKSTVTNGQMEVYLRWVKVNGKKVKLS